MDKLTWNELDNAELQYRILVARAFRGNAKLMDMLVKLYQINPQENERIRYLGALIESSQKYGNITDKRLLAIFKKWDVDHLLKQVISGQVV